MHKYRLWLAFVVVAFAFGGWLTLRASRAATNTVAFEAEHGSTSNAFACGPELTSDTFVRLNGDCQMTHAAPVYGVPWYAYSLNNFVIGVQDYRASFRFTSTQTQPIESVKYYVVFTDARPGYNAGNCGDLQVSIQADSGPPNHQPSGAALGSYTITEPCGPNEFGQKPTFPRHGFTPAVQLQKGARYHIVFANTDPSMDANWVSINGMYDYSGPSPRQRGAADADFAVLTSTDGGQNWEEHTKDTPILEVAFANGTVQGQTYMEYDYDSNESTDLSPGQAIRQIITPSKSDVTVNSIHVRAGQSDWSNQVYPNSKGRLTLKSDTGTILADAEFIPYQQSDFWTDIDLDSPITLQKNATYYLEATALVGPLMFIAMQEGTTYDFSPSLSFTDGYLEINKGSGWQAYSDEGKPQSCQCHDMSFYFD